MKNSSKILLGIAAVVIVVAGIIYSKFTAKLPNDGANAKMSHFENILDTRYLEVFIIGGNAITGNIKAAVYNTVGLNGNIQGNSAPQHLVDKINVEKIKKEFNSLRVIVNGPRIFCLDWIDVPVGVERDFNGLKAAWVATLLLSREQTGEKIPYKSTTVERKSAFGINKGTTVFLLDDDKGNTWVMKSYSLVLDSTMTREKVPTMLAKLKLPTGWSYRVKVLDEDLLLKPESGVATIVPDDLDNMYDLTGAGYSNYKP